MRYTKVASSIPTLPFFYFFTAFTGFETNNKYEVKNTLGQKVYFAVEDNDCCTRYDRSAKKFRETKYKDSCSFKEYLPNFFALF